MPTPQTEFSRPRIAHRATAVIPLLIVLAVFGAVVAPALAASGSWRGMPLVDALERLRADGLGLVYSDELVPGGLQVVEEPSANSPRGILEQLLAPHGLVAHTGPGGSWLITRAAPAATGKLRGRIVQQENRHLPLARVFVPALGQSATCDRSGRFELVLPPGSWKITVAAPGFVTHSITAVAVQAGETTDVVWSLDWMVAVHESIRVTGERGSADRAAAAESTGLARELLDLAPSLAEDPYEVVRRLPGVADAETTAELNVRGGRGDEVLLLLDGLELPQAFHVPDLGGGLVSFLDSTTIEQVDYFGGAFPARYGNRISGVLEMTTTSAALGTGGEVALTRGLFRARSHGTMRDGRGDWLVSGRVGDPELLVKEWVSESEFNPNYKDLLGKVTYRVGPRTVVSAHTLLAFDENEGRGAIDENDANGDSEARVNTRYENGYVWLTADTIWRSSLLSRTMLAWGRNDVDRAVSDAGAVETVIDKRDFLFTEFGQDWRVNLGARHQLRFGLDARRQEARYTYRSELAGSADPQPPESVQRATVSGAEYSVYVSDTFRVHPSLLIEPGLRFDFETYTEREDAVTSPRLNIAWSVSPGTTLRAGWGRFHQFQRIYELQIEDGVTTFFPVERSEHRQIGVEHRFDPRRVGRVSVFEKRQGHLRPWFENLFDPVVFVPEASADRVQVRSDRAVSRGLEATLNGREEFGLNWSASYTLSSAEDVIDGRKEPRLWDQRHAVDIALQYDLGGRWELGLTGVWHSGRPTTAVVAVPGTAPDGSPVTVPTLGRRNDERYPSYSRVDTRAARRLSFGNQRVKLFVNVANVFDSSNVCCTDAFDLVKNPDDGPRFEADERHGLRRSVNVGISWEFGD